MTSKSPSPKYSSSAAASAASASRDAGTFFRGLSVKRRAAPHVTDATGALGTSARSSARWSPSQWSGSYQFSRQLFRSASRAALHSFKNSPQGVSGAIGVAWATCPAYA